MKRIFAACVTVILFLTLLFPAHAEGTLELTAPGAILVEKSTGTVLYEKNADERMRPASVTKIMTILLIMEAIESGQYGYNDIVTASAYATSMGGSQVYLKENEQMTVDEMLKCIIVASANDACVAMAEFTAGSVDAFVDKMNARASELGMTGTTFQNCTGLEAEGHLTTARDIATMSRELLKHENVKNYTTIWMDSIRSGTFGLTNTNKLIRFYDKATGLKTGYTKESMYCIAATAEDNGMELIAVIMAAPSSDQRNAEAKALLNYGFATSALYQAAAQDIPEIPVIKGKSRTVKPVLHQIENIVVPKGKEKEVICEMDICQDVEAPVEKNQKLGEARFVLDGEAVAVADITASDAVERAGVLDIMRDIIYQFLIV